VNRRRGAAAVAALLVVVVLACTPRAGVEGAEPRSAAERGLITSLDVRVDAGTVQLALHVTNGGDEALVLEFSTAQRYDFEIRGVDGTLLWRWSSDMMFAQALGTVRLEAGESMTYRAEWTAAVAAGWYSAVGRVQSTNVPIELQTTFEVL
jgi:hypothetical protein